MDLILWRRRSRWTFSPILRANSRPRGEAGKAIAQWLEFASAQADPDHRQPGRARNRPRRRSATISKSTAGSRPALPDRGAGRSRLARAQGAVVIVGHQPALGMAAALLIAGEPMPWSIKKGAIWWLSRRVRGEDPQVVLRAVMSPDLI